MPNVILLHICLHITDDYIVGLISHSTYQDLMFDLASAASNNFELTISN